MSNKNKKYKIVSIIIIFAFCIQGISMIPFGGIGNMMVARNDIKTKNTLGTSPGIQASGTGVNTFPTNLEYPATYSFQNGTWAGWTIPSGWNYPIINITDYHNSTLHVTGGGNGVGCIVTRNFTRTQYGYVEFYLFYNDTQSKWISIVDPSNQSGIVLNYTGGVFKCHDQGLQDGRFGPCTVALNAWHFVSIEFDCTDGGYHILGKDPLDRYHYNIWVDSVLQFKDYPMIGNPTNLSQIRVGHALRATTTLDAVEFFSQPGHKDIVVNAGESRNVTTRTITWTNQPINTDTEVVHDITVTAGNLAFNCNGMHLHVDGMIRVSSTTTIAGNLTLQNNSMIDSKDGLKYNAFYNDKMPEYDELYCQLRGDEKDSDLCLVGTQWNYGTWPIYLSNPMVTISGNSVLRCDGFWALHGNVTMYKNATLNSTFFGEYDARDSRFNATDSMIICDKSFSIDYAGTKYYSGSGSTQYFLYLSRSVLNSSYIFLEGDETAIALIDKTTVNGLLSPDGEVTVLISGNSTCKSKIMMLYTCTSMCNVQINNTVIGIDVHILLLSGGSNNIYTVRPGNQSLPSPFQDYFVDSGGASYTEEARYTGSSSQNVRVLKNETTFGADKPIQVVNCSTPTTKILDFTKKAFNTSLIYNGALEAQGDQEMLINCEFYSLESEFSRIATEARTTFSWNLNSSAISWFANTGTVNSNVLKVTNKVFNCTFVNCWFCSDYKTYFGYPWGCQYQECWDFAFNYFHYTYIDCHINPATQVQFFGKGNSSYNVMFINAGGYPVSKDAWNARKFRYAQYNSTGNLGILGKQISCTVRLPTNCSRFTMVAACSFNNQTRTISDGSSFNFSITSSTAFTITLTQNSQCVVARYIKATVWNNQAPLILSNPVPSDNYTVRVNISATFKGLCKAGGVDLRFLDSARNYLPYWIETWSQAPAIIWVVSVNHSNAITMYYDNSLPASFRSESSGNATFVLFDDFSGASVNSNLWNVQNDDYSSVTVAGGKIDVKSDGYFLISEGAYMGFSDYTTTTGNYTINNAASFGGRNTILTAKSGLHNLQFDQHGGIWYTFETCRINSSSVKYFKNDTQACTITANIPTATLSVTLVGTVNCFFFYYHYAMLSSKTKFGIGYAVRMSAWSTFSTNGEVKCDWLLVRSCTSNEPIATVSCVEDFNNWGTNGTDIYGKASGQNVTWTTFGGSGACWFRAVTSPGSNPFGDGTSAWGHWYKEDGGQNGFGKTATFSMLSPKTPSTTCQYWASFDLKVLSGNPTNWIILSQDTGSPPSIKNIFLIFDANGKVYDNTNQFVETGLTWANNIAYNVVVQCLSNSTFHCSLDGGITWSNTMDCQTTWTGPIQSWFLYTGRISIGIQDMENFETSW